MEQLLPNGCSDLRWQFLTCWLKHEPLKVLTLDLIVFLLCWAEVSVMGIYLNPHLGKAQMQGSCYGSQ